MNIKKIKKYTWWCGGLALAVLVFSTGWTISKRSWNGEVFVSFHSMEEPSFTGSRNIASVQKSVPISSFVLKKGVLTAENQKVLVRSSKVKNFSNKVHLYLGHTLVKAKKGGTVLACQEYQTVDMVFMAEGTSFHGHVPKMVLKADCQFDPENPLYIGPFVIPKKKILSSPVSQQIFKTKEKVSENLTNTQARALSSLVNKEAKGVLSFSHVSLQWPQKWVLEQIRFINEQNKKDLTVSFPNTGKKEDFITLNFK